MNWTNFRRNFISLAGGSLAALLLLEAFLRIFNPIPYYVKGDKIILPVNQKVTIINQDYPFYSRVIVRTINSIGFRGSDPPSNFSDYLTLITVGGSTTRDANLSDDETWTHLLGERLNQRFDKVWVNNGGLDGTSTFGHIILLEDYIAKLRPKIVLFLIGANDVVRKPDKFDYRLLKDDSRSPKALLKKSEVVSLLINLRRAYQARKAQLLKPFGYFSSGKAKHYELSGEEQEKLFAQATNLDKLASYADRVEGLIEISRASGIEPILVTQPTVVGDLLDPATGLNLATIEAGTLDSMNGSLYARVLAKFNDMTQSIAKAHNVLVIDLAAKMPKSTEFFTDTLHFTKAGSSKVSELIFEDLWPHLAEDYQGYIKSN